MRAMTQEQQALLTSLLRLAGGDSLLVEQALRANVEVEQGPELEAVRRYIVEALARRRAAPAREAEPH